MVVEFKYLHCECELRCPHGGKVVIRSPAQRSFLPGGIPVLTAEDLEGAIVLGCTLAPPFKKCTRVVSIALGKVADVTVDGQTPLLHNLVFVTDSTPPGFGRAAGTAHGVVTRADVAGAVLAPTKAAPAPATKKNAKKPAATKVGTRTIRVRLKKDSLPAGRPEKWAPTVVVHAGQARAKEACPPQEKPLPLDGSEVEFTFDLDPKQECWVVVTTRPFVNVLDAIEAVGRRPRRVVTADEAFPLEGAARAEAVAAYGDLARLDGLSPAPPERLLAQLNGVAAGDGRRQQPPAGGVVRAPVRLGPGEERVEVEPAYPTLLAMSWSLGGLDKALEVPRKYNRQGLSERLALARLCANLEAASPWLKFSDAFAHTARAVSPRTRVLQRGWGYYPASFPAPLDPGPIYEAFLKTHRWKRRVWAEPLHQQLQQVRDRVAVGRTRFADARREYVLFTTRSPHFLGTCDLDRAGPRADSELPTYLTHTVENEAVRLLRRALRLLDEGVQLLMLLQALEDESPTAPTPAEFEAWQDFFVAAEETWGFGTEPAPPAGGAVAGPKPPRSLSGWKLLSKVLEALVKHTAKEVRKNREIASWVDEQGRLTLSWLVARERDTKSIKRVVELLGENGKPYKPAQLVGRSKMKGKSSKARARQAAKERVKGGAGKRLRLLRQLYPVVAAMMLIEQTRAALTRTWRADDPVGFGIDVARTTLSGVKLAQAGLEAYVEFKWAGTLALKGKTRGTAQKVLEGLARPGKWAKALGHVATWGEAVVGVTEVGRDHYRGDHARGLVRTVGVSIALGAALWGATLGAAPALLVALGAVAVGVVLDTVVSEMELSEEERGLRDLLRKTEFGNDGYPTGRDLEDVYEHRPEAAIKVPPRVAEYLAGMPWRVLPALIPTKRGLSFEYALGFVVRHRPAPLLCPVSYARVTGPGGPFLLGVEARPDPDDAGNSRVALTLAREEQEGMPLERIEARRCFCPDAGETELRHLPYLVSGQSLVLFPPPGFFARPVVVEGLVVPPGGDLVVVFGPNPLSPPPLVPPPSAVPFGDAVVGQPGCIAWPALRLEVLQRAPALRVVTAKEPVPRKRARLFFPVDIEAGVEVVEEAD
jgi:hypothetical protein